MAFPMNPTYLEHPLKVFDPPSVANICRNY